MYMIECDYEEYEQHYSHMRPRDFLKMVRDREKAKEQIKYALEDFDVKGLKNKSWYSIDGPDIRTK